MTRRLAWNCGVAVAITMATGCDDLARDAEPSEDAVTARAAQENGIRLNGIRLNGIRLNGIRLNGDGNSDFVDLLHIDLKGKDEADTAWLVGSNLHVKTTDGKTLSGVALDKTRIEFDVQEGGKAKQNRGIKVRDITPLAPGSDVWLYDLDIKLGSGGWEPLCIDELGEPTEAILLGDVWNPATGGRVEQISGGMTFACRDAALAKCVEFGYRPWAATDGTSLRDYHQACTRLVRADYCGDGSSHTVNGTKVHVLDQVGVQKLDLVAQFAVEAEWGPNGAVCVNPGNLRHPELPYDCEIPTCGAPFASGGLIQSGKIFSP